MSKYPQVIYGVRLAEGTRHQQRPCVVGHSKPDGGDWYFWPEDYEVFVPGFSDPYPTQDAAERAAEEWNND